MNEKTVTVPRFFQPDLWDLPGIESWLAAMAAKGLHYRYKGNTFVWFTKGPPKAVRYRLDAVSPLSPTPDVERREEAAELGWRYEDELDDFSVYVCEDPAAPELHTDPVTQSYTLDKIARKMRWELVLLVGSVLFVVAVVYYGIRTGTFSVLNLTDRSSVIFLIPAALLQLALLPFSLQRCTRLLSLRRSLKAGLPMEHRADYRRQAQLSVLYSVSIFLFFGLYLCTSLWELYSPPSWSITEETPSPIAYSLSDLESAPTFRPSHYEGPYGDKDYDNFVSCSWSLLIPTQYEITRRGEIPGRTRPDGGDYEPQLVMHYYQPIAAFLAAPLFDDLLKEEGEGRTRTELTYSGLDEALLLTIPEGTFTMLLLRTDHQVLWVEYWGTADLAADLPQLTAALENME